MSQRSRKEPLSIAPQEFEDPVSGMIFKFVRVPGSDAPSRIYFKSKNSRSWRELCFDHSGNLSAATTKISSAPRVPDGLRLVK
jgi:hypothetical protein